MFVCGCVEKLSWKVVLLYGAWALSPHRKNVWGLGTEPPPEECVVVCTVAVW